MCTYITEHVALGGSAKGPDGWFPVETASVYFDHPVHAPYDHSLNIDFLNPSRGPASRVAVELSRESALELARAILSTIEAGDQSHAVAQ